MPRPGFTYITADTWGRDADGSLWLDVPAAMVRRGLPIDDLGTRKWVGRMAITQLREALGADADTTLIVARVNGMGDR